MSFSSKAWTVIDELYVTEAIGGRRLGYYSYLEKHTQGDIVSQWPSGHR